MRLNQILMKWPYSNKTSRDDTKIEQMLNWSILSDLIKYVDESSMFRHDCQCDCENIGLWKT